MPIKITTESFIEEAKKIHGDRYDYKLVKYTKYNIPLDIICTEHGLFKQLPNSHIRGSGCPKCGALSSAKTRKISKENFIKKANKVHNNKYDYSLVDVSKNNVDIICPEHGDFNQKIVNHITRKNGCPKCRCESNRKKFQMSVPQFIELSDKKHNSKYNYSLVRFNNIKDHIIITCPIHNNFTQLAEAHLRGSGCPSCAGNKKLTELEFAQRVSLIHPEYTLIKKCFKGLAHKYRMICPIHGEFLSIAANVLFKKSGCPKCATSGFNPDKEAILYYLYDPEEDLYKIGITNKDTSSRFGASFLRDRKVEILMEETYQNGQDAYLAEQEILQAFESARTTNPTWPETLGGKTEFFNRNILEL